MDTKRKVAVIVGATSKWQPDGRNTLMRHGRALESSDFPIESRWGIGGAVAQKFSREGYCTVLTTRTARNASGLKAAIDDQGGESTIIELDLRSKESIRSAFATIRDTVGEPNVVVYNAGYLEGRDMPAGQELLEFVADEVLEAGLDLACRGPFLVAKEVLPAMRAAGAGSFFLTNNQYCLRGRKRLTGESLYYPRVLMRTLAQVLTDEYTEYGVHIANVIIDGFIDSPGTRELPEIKADSERLLNPARIADAYYYLHTQHRSCWTHEIQLTSSKQKTSY